MSFVDSDQKIPVPAQSTDRQKGDELVLKKKKKVIFENNFLKLSAKPRHRMSSFPLKVQNTEKLACKPKANSCLHAVPSCSCSHCLSGQHRQE